jgi:hypothetical protein
LDLSKQQRKKRDHVLIARQTPKPKLGEIINLPTTQAAIDRLEAALIDLPQVECPITNHFGPGIYIREMFAPKDTIIVGHAHKKPCMNVLVKGSMQIVDPDGQPRVITAPMMFVTGPGRKAAVILEDCVFQNIWATDETDLDRLEEQLIDKSETWLAHASSDIALLQGE